MNESIEEARAILAGLALQGLLAASKISPDDPVGAAAKAVAHADALLAELKKPK